MARNPNDLDVSSADIEAIADAALGEDSPKSDRQRALSVGARLTARQLLSDRRKRAFIIALAETGNVSRAATAAGWPRGTALALKKADKEFAELWDQALEFATDALEDEARRRALSGVRKPVYQQGKLVGYVQEYSDALMKVLLSAHRPEKFRDNMKHEVDVKGGVLVVPGVKSDGDWEKQAGDHQAAHRSNQGDGGGEDPLK